MDDAIYEVMVAWPLEWRAPDLAVVERMAAQQRKKEIQLRLTKMVKRTRQG